MLTRVDPNVAFDWGEASPAAGVPIDGWSVRWSGWIRPRFSQTYTFTTRTDDGARLWVNGTLLVDDWTDHGITETPGSITLLADTWYPIRMEYYERWGGAVAQLFWQSASEPRQLVPSSRLSPAAAPPPQPPGTPDAATPDAAMPDAGAPPIDAAAPPIDAAVDSGTPATTPGLRAEYYRDVDLSLLALTRVDPQVNFNWGEGTPATRHPG